MKTKQKPGIWIAATIVACLVLFYWVAHKATNHDIPQKEKQVQTIPTKNFSLQNFSKAQTQNKIAGRDIETSFTTVLNDYQPLIKIDKSEAGFLETKNISSSPQEKHQFDIEALETENNTHYFSIGFANDIFNNTDYYFTNGIEFEYVHSSIKKSPIASLLMRGPIGAQTIYGLTLAHNMYTPSNPDLEEIMQGDRPFSAYLYLGHFKVSVNKHTGNRMKSGINLGVIGSGALGGHMQDLIHDVQPKGWVHQIRNDLVLEYYVDYEHRLLQAGNFRVDGLAGMKIGTLYDNAHLGLSLAYGNHQMINSFSKAGLPGQKEKIKYSFYVRTNSFLIAYDATLQGGLINNKSEYTLPDSHISRFTFQAKAGFTIYYKGISISAEQNYLSPEYSIARPHRWVLIKTAFSI
jgi:lipid A 3-O-deacylase